MKVDKIKSYIGFAIKSKSIIFGLDTIKEKKVNLIVYANSMSESSKKSIKIISEKQKCPCYEIQDDEMLNLTNQEKIKAFGIMNIELAKAIINNM